MIEPARGGLGPLSEILVEKPEAVEEREKTALENLLAASGGRCVLFGAGTLGRKAIRLLRGIGVEPLAVADSNPDRWDTTCEDLTILSPARAAELYGASATFFVTIWNDFHWFRDTLATLTALGCTSVSSYAPIFWRFGDRFMDLRLLNDLPHKLYEQLDAVLEAETVWADQESLETFRSNILWRAFGDASHLPFPAPRNTYFPADVFRLLPNETVVDCGAFDGDTIRFLVNLVGADFGGIHAIEADTFSIEKLTAYTASLDESIGSKVHRHECAVGEERGVLRFAMSGNATSSSNDAGVDVQCYALDELFHNTPVTLIKMDIEGAEYDALKGARKVIERDQPILAICVYHTQKDIWRIPNLVRTINPAYQMFLRSYDGDGFQTVMYAVPPERMLSAMERASAPKPLKLVSQQSS